MVCFGGNVRSDALSEGVMSTALCPTMLVSFERSETRAVALVQIDKACIAGAHVCCIASAPWFASR
jgi:hypothetical protein